MLAVPREPFGVGLVFPGQEPAFYIRLAVWAYRSVSGMGWQAFSLAALAGLLVYLLLTGFFSGLYRQRRGGGR